MFIKKLYKEDSQQMCAFLHAVSDDFPVPLSSKVCISSYVDKLLMQGFTIGAYSEDGKLLGVAAGYANDQNLMTAYLSVIVTCENARGCGISGALLDAFEDEARLRGMCIVRLSTHHANARAISFYKKAGYLLEEASSQSCENLTFSKLLCGLSSERPNILLTSVGRRAYLVDWFKDALVGTGEVHVVNSESSTPAFAAADHSEVCPLIYSEEYFPFLLDYVKEHHIGAILSLFDIDIPVLASHRADFVRSGCFPIVASPSAAEVCNDKLATSRYLSAIGISAVDAYSSADSFLDAVSSGRAAFPAYVKPRWGMGSIGVLEAEDEFELRAACSMVARKVAASYLRFESSTDPDNVVIVQPAVEGTECGMDVMNGLDGLYRGCSVRRKVAMRAGETDVAETIVGDSRFDELARSLSKALACPGNIDVDVFDTPEGLIVLEMNARFGGGYPFSHMAGVNLPSALVSWLRGQDEPEGFLECSHPGKFMKEIGLVRLEG